MTEILANAKELYVLMHRVNMLYGYLMNIGFPYTVIYQHCERRPCDFVEEVLEYRPPEEKKLNPEDMAKEINHVSDLVRQMENWLKGLGYPKSELYVDFDKEDRQQVYVRNKK